MVVDTIEHEDCVPELYLELDHPAIKDEQGPVRMPVTPRVSNLESIPSADTAQQSILDSRHALTKVRH